MGIRGLMSLITKHSPNASKILTPEELKNKIFIIDSSILLYKYSYASKNYENAHISGFFNRITTYLHAGVLPVFIFDGKPPDAKLETLQKRKDEKRKLYLRVEKLEDELKNITVPSEIEQIKKQIKSIRNQIVHVTPNQKNDIINLLTILGIPFIESEGEAEHTCSFMQKTGLGDFTLTDDSDAFAFGSTKVIRFIKNNDISKLECYHLNDIFKDMQLNHESFVDMCILCGCDFSDTIPRVGSLTAYNLIKKYENIENILQENIKLKPTQKFNYKGARTIFNSPHADIDKSSITLNNYDDNAFQSFLSKHNYTQTQIFKMNNKMKKSRQIIINIRNRK